MFYDRFIGKFLLPRKLKPWRRVILGKKYKHPKKEQAWDACQPCVANCLPERNSDNKTGAADGCTGPLVHGDSVTHSTYEGLSYGAII